ncbi:uncharacterized protein LOC134260370 isoform X2 [Saccostrea cucullata]|uniref:uncharacterized protein LOC134260370 isoform X2 n=1 Tax=Saccostrea cuccullata TaxID=36930 RepID=UPI002ED02623
MVLGSVCENNTCACRDGYVSFNDDSECSLQDRVVGLMVGAVFGGLILGIVLTVLGVICYKNIRNGKPKNAKKDDQTAVVFNNTSYETERGADQNRFAEQRTNEKQIVNVPPFAHSVDLPGTKNARTHHGNKSSMMKSYDVNDDVYNHLHEKEEDSENDETYDHAHGNINSAMDDSDYSNLNTGIRYKEPDVSAAEVNDYDDREPPGDYCAL